MMKDFVAAWMKDKA